MERLLTLYSEVQSTDVRWLWYPFIAIGKITLLQGDPGDGKSTMMMNLIAELSTGGLKTSLGIRVLLYWMSPNGKQALLQYRFRNVKNLKIYLRQIYRNSLKTYNNQAMRLLREECRHEFGTNYEFAGDNSG